MRQPRDAIMHGTYCIHQRVSGLLKLCNLLLWSREAAHSFAIGAFDTIMESGGLHDAFEIGRISALNERSNQ